MKKTIIISMLAGLALSAGAQNMWDAYNYSQTNYLGTARSVGMGNAMTAVGGDLGSLTFNPAGSAVAGYSQITLSPGISIASVNAMGLTLDGDKSPYCFGDENVNSKTKMIFPNFGFMFNFDTHRTRGVKSWSFGIAGNATNNYNSELYASGENMHSSYMGWLSTQANGINVNDIKASNAWDNASIPWPVIVGWDAGLISNTVEDGEVIPDQYIGTSEKIFPDGTMGIAGDLSQKYGRLTSGNKYDILMNFGANINDKLFIGANLGVTSLDYRYNEYIYEAAVDPQDFDLNFDETAKTYFRDMRSRFALDTDGSGVYFKAGFIATPFSGLRLGAAIQTPTAMTIKESWSYDAYTTYTDSQWDASGGTDYPGTSTYHFRTPYLLDAGIAYTFGNYGMISADYELCDYSTMRFRTRGSNFYGDDDYAIQNEDIVAGMKASHLFRLGAEFRPTPSFAVRAGYNYTSTPFKDTVNAARQAVSAGLGYSSNGSFFADLAVRATFMPDEFVKVYEDYLNDMPSPEILAKTKKWDVIFTLGWRF